MVEGVTMEAAESCDGTDPERTPVRSKLLIFYLKQIKNIIFVFYFNCYINVLPLKLNPALNRFEIFEHESHVHHHASY